MLRSIAANAQSLRAWSDLKGELDYNNSFQFNSLAKNGFMVVTHQLAAAPEELKHELPDQQTSYTTSCKLDLDKALIKSIQVLNDGGRWLIRN